MKRTTLLAMSGLPMTALILLATATLFTLSGCSSDSNRPSSHKSMAHETERTTNSDVHGQGAADTKRAQEPSPERIPDSTRMPELGWDSLLEIYFQEDPRNRKPGIAIDNFALLVTFDTNSSEVNATTAFINAPNKNQFLDGIERQVYDISKQFNASRERPTLRIFMQPSPGDRVLEEIQGIAEKYDLHYEESSSTWTDPLSPE